nr:hypothetical protein Iba_chr01bCG15100 [Ipomoea batatas]GMC52125.1 hypothetical protein Iba_chr01cCG12690 [Ipomoea batatas]GMC54819.1 hypothetical protein Iba_chr01eCG1530 [Ipomoea batatas]
MASCLLPSPPDASSSRLRQITPRLSLLSCYLPDDAILTEEEVLVEFRNRSVAIVESGRGFSSREANFAEFWENFRCFR